MGLNMCFTTDTLNCETVPSAHLLFIHWLTLMPTQPLKEHVLNGLHTNAADPHHWPEAASRGGQQCVLPRYATERRFKYLTCSG